MKKYFQQMKNDIHSKIIFCGHKARAKTRCLMGNADVPPSYIPFILQLAKEEGPSQLDLVNSCGLKAPTVSITLRKMEEDGYVTRVVDEDDSRRVRVFLTEKGRSFEEKAKKTRSAVTKRMEQGFTKEELNLFLSFLDRAIENLEN